MSDIVVIVPPDFVEGFQLAGARVYAATDAAVAKGLLVASLQDARAGIVGVADVYYSVLDSATRRAAERSYRPVVVGIPAGARPRPEGLRRLALQGLIRRAVGLKVALGEGYPDGS